jgi:cytidylate kinase
VIKFYWEVVFLIITIDGPAGAGKSTVAKIVAQKLNFSYLDSGAIYRTLTLACLQNNVNLEDEEMILKLLDKVELSFNEVVEGERRIFKCYLNGKDVTEDIRLPEVSKAVSIVARHSRVRERLLFYQKKFAENRNVVCDGRDMGTIVFKTADYKFFLTASPEVRAKRRYQELKSLGVEVDYEEVYQNIVFRDATDSNREASPLKPAPEALIIDTTNIDPETVAKKIISVIKERMKP